MNNKYAGGLKVAAYPSQDGPATEGRSSSSGRRLTMCPTGAPGVAWTGSGAPVFGETGAQALIRAFGPLMHACSPASP